MNSIPPPYQNSPPPSRPKFVIPLLIAVLALVGLGIVGGVAAFRSGVRTTNAARVVADKFFLELSAHRYANAYAMLAPQIQSTTTPEDMQDMQELVEKRHVKVTFTRASGWYINSNNGVTTVTLNYQANYSAGAKPANVVVMDTPAGMKIAGYHYGS